MDKNAKTIGVIPLRSGSKGLPGKNTRILGGLQLYLHAVHQALRTLGNCIVTTDIEVILSANHPKNCLVVRRPPELAESNTPMAKVLEHLITQQDLSANDLVLLQATSPLRLDKDINSVLELYATGKFDLVMSVTRKDSNVLKYGTIVNGSFLSLRSPNYCFYNRQELPFVYGPNGAVYIFNGKDFLNSNGFPVGAIGAYEMPIERSYDIDTLEDFRKVETAFKELQEY